MSRLTLKISDARAKQVYNFQQSLYQEAEKLFSHVIPQKVLLIDAMLKDEAFNVTDVSLLQAPLEIPIPDPPSPEDEDMETDKNDDDKKKKKAPKCGFIQGNEKILKLMEKVKPEIVALREAIITTTCWIQHLIPKIEDGNDFGVAIQEKILERIGAVRVKMDGFHPSLTKYLSERGDAVAKASKETHVMDYRSLVHKKDVDIYNEIRVILLDIRGFYIEFYDIITKNWEKVNNPKGEEKPSMY